MSRDRDSRAVIPWAASIVLCLGFFVAWLRSYWAHDAVPFAYHGQRWELASVEGALRVTNAPQGALDARATDARLAKAANLVDRLDYELLPRFIGLHRRISQDPHNASKHLAELRDLVADEKTTIDRIKALGYQPRLAPLDLSRFSVDDAHDWSMMRTSDREGGVMFVSEPPPIYTPAAGFSVPYSYILFFALVGLLWREALELRKRSRVRRGMCANCNYDLRASSERCPECGAVKDGYNQQRDEL
ncbi:MAG: hypothetical protein JWO87_1043 [Phycisphaerales bacterium]|nr:hypothetical protein [Phycisphaerales bacterium]